MNTLNFSPKRTLTFLLALSCIPLVCLVSAAPAQAQSKKEVTRIAFKKDKFNRIFLPAKVDKDTIALLFATYSKTLRLTPYFYETRQLWPSFERLVSTDKYGGPHSKSLYYLPRIEIGPLKFRNEETVINQAFPDSIATGSTGTLMVYQYNWKINNDRNEMLVSKTPFSADQAYTTISYKNNTFPTAVVNISKVNSEFILDLGSGAGFLLSSSTAIGQAVIEDYHLRPARTVTSNIHSDKLVDTIYEAVIPSMTFNGITLKNQKIVISSAAPHNIIGTGFLGNYNVILNNSKKRKIQSSMILEKRLVN
ncbi:hypothetical protein SAMN06265348_104415 [Pedobacter westerhofensis]|uniref:Aspartyl protease n=1 Tax=Pedobacter westerhofensis TaxID=425512 RepID=A0A521D2F4_9SPHI|nr:hypothetical protein [Pedobacter westerhofensis]SMO65876.1 hypothetical protein SAMN06265348_104415 [Pedobacter westerhofensis]